MAITKVQGPVTGTAATNTVTVSFAAPATAGNLLIAAGRANVGVAAGASITGWTLATSARWGSADSDIVLFYKVAAGGEQAVQLNWTSATSINLIIHEWTGLHASAPLDQIASSSQSGAVTSKTSGTTPTTTVANELAFALVGTGNTVTAQTFNNSFTADGAEASVLFAAVKVLSATGTPETTLSWTTARFAAGLIATFKEASAGGADVRKKIIQAYLGAQ